MGVFREFSPEDLERFNNLTEEISGIKIGTVIEFAEQAGISTPEALEITGSGITDNPVTEYKQMQDIFAGLRLEGGDVNPLAGLAEQQPSNTKGGREV